MSTHGTRNVDTPDTNNQEIWNNFKGKYADDAQNLRNNLTTNSINVARMLRHACALVNHLKECARVENDNRKAARDWKKKRDEQYWFHDMYDDMRGDHAKYTEFNDDPPGPGASVPAPPLVAASTTGEPGTSSAVPDDIDTYVSSCNRDTGTHKDNYDDITEN